MKTKKLDMPSMEEVSSKTQHSSRMIYSSPVGLQLRSIYEEAPQLVRNSIVQVSSKIDGAAKDTIATARHFVDSEDMKLLCIMTATEIVKVSPMHLSDLRGMTSAYTYALPSLGAQRTHFCEWTYKHANPGAYNLLMMSSDNEDLEKNPEAKKLHYAAYLIAGKMKMLSILGTDEKSTIEIIEQEASKVGRKVGLKNYVYIKTAYETFMRSERQTKVRPATDTMPTFAVRPRLH